MRWKAGLVGLFLMSAIGVGCKQQCFMNECDYRHYHDIGLPPNLECKPPQCLPPLAGNVPAPTTVLDPDRPPRYISLAEAIAIALEQGEIGAENAQGAGGSNDTLASFAGGGVSLSDSIRVLSLDPAILATNIESALSRFDVRWDTAITWNKTDRPIGTPLDVFAAGAQNINATNTDDAHFQTGLIKPLPTGGVAGITFTTDYELTNLNARVNPSYRPALQFAFEQPLLQGFGVEINQLRSSHPGGQFIQFPNQSRTEGILITRLRFDQARIEFERIVNFMVLNVEVAYWNLYGSYWTLYSREQALRQAYEAWKINKARFEAGRIPIQDFAQSRQQYELFRGQRISALGDVLERERQLRGLLALPIEDCVRLVPCDSPTLSPYNPDWCTALNEAMALLPSLLLARQDLKFRQLDLINQKDQLRPDLRFFANYDINGIGSQLDGPAGPNALHSLASNHFNNWEIGIRADIPIGYRDAHAAVRAARLNLLKSYNSLYDQELKAQRALALSYRRVFEFYEQIQAQRALREAAATQLEARFKEFLAGRGTLDFLLEAQRVWADALNSEYSFIVQYNNNLAIFELSKGTLLQQKNVYIAEGPLPQCAQMRAVDHQKERTKAIVARQRAIPQPACCSDPAHATAGLPVLPTNEAPATSELLKEKPAVPDHLPVGVDVLYARPNTATVSGQTGSPTRSIPGTIDLPTAEPKRLPDSAQPHP